MDAKHAKILSGVAVALLVGSVFGVGLVAAQDVNPTDAPDVVFDFGADTKTIGGTDYLVTPIDGTVGKITYNSSWDVTITNLTQDGTYTLEADGASVSAQATAGNDNMHGPGTFNVTFSSANIGAVGPVQGRFDQVGDWILKRNGVEVGRILVNATENLRVSLSQSTFPFSASQIGFRITVTEIGSGVPVSSATVTLEGAGTIGTTNANGHLDWTGSTPAAGEYTVRAEKSAPGTPSSTFEYAGEATLMVNPAALTATAVSVDVLRGFSGAVEFNMTLPNNVPALKAFGVGSHPGLDWKINITYPANNDYPSGCWIVYYGTSSTVGAANSADSSCTLSEFPRTLTIEANGNLKFSDDRAAGWGAGQYRVDVGINTIGGIISGGGSPEYVASFAWTPGTPADVNIGVSSGSLVEGKLEVGAPRGSTAAEALQNPVTLTVTVTGQNQTEHPSVPSLAARQAFTRDNVTLEGDFLRIVDQNGNQLAPSISEISTSGVFTISNLYPTMGGGKVTVSVYWKDAWWVKEIPISKGSMISASADSVVVDTTSEISFTLRGLSGAADPFGEVRIYRITNAQDTADISSLPKHLTGTGFEGLGQDGRYTFAIKPDTLGTYLAVGIVGQSENKTYSYTTFRVVPAQDLQVDVRGGANAMAGRTNTVTLNVTMADGATFGTTPSFWFMNSGQAAYFAEHGALPSGIPNSDVTPFFAGGQLLWYNVSLPATMAPDTYTVYVRSSDAKRDNGQAMPTAQLHHVRLSFSPAGVVDNADIQKDEPLAITVVDWEGLPINGTLRLNTSSKGEATWQANFSGSPLQATVTNGMVNTVVTGSKLGPIAFFFQPSGGSQYYDALGTFEIVPPNVVVSPSKIPVGQTSPVVVTVKDLKGAPIPNIPVQICGPPLGGDNSCTGNRTTDSAGISRVGVLPFATGNLTLRINGTASPTVVEVFAGLNIVATPAEPKVGDLVAIAVAQPGRIGESDVLVSITDSSGASIRQDITDVRGVVTWTPAREGVYTISAAKDGFETATTPVTVSTAPPPPPVLAPAFTISDLTVTPSRLTVGSPATVTAQVSNTGTAAGDAVLRLKVNGATFDTRVVPLATGERDTVAFTFTPSAQGDYRVTVSVGQQELPPMTVTVSAPTAPPPPTGPAEPTGPQGGVPGFEVLFALGALGVAFLLVSRRKR